MGESGEELVSCPALCQAPSSSAPLCPFNWSSCLPRLGSGWCNTLHLALLGRLQEEAGAGASSTLVFSCHQCQEVPGPHREKDQEKDAVGQEREGSYPTSLRTTPHGITWGEFIQPSTASSCACFLNVGPPSVQETEPSLPLHCIHRVRPTCDREPGASRTDTVSRICSPCLALPISSCVPGKGPRSFSSPRAVAPACNPGLSNVSDIAEYPCDGIRDKVGTKK